MSLINSMTWDDIGTVVVPVAAAVLGGLITWVSTSQQAKKARQLALDQQHKEFDQLKHQQERDFQQQITQQEKAYALALQQEDAVHQLALRQDEQTQKLVHANAIEQSRVNHNIMVSTDRLRREIAALEAVWELLEYMTQRKNDKAIIRWRTERDEEGKKTKTYFFHHQSLEAFMFRKISGVFYQQHAGLFISNKVRDLVNSYRSVAGEFYFAHQRSNPEVPDDGLILINSPEKAVELEGIYDELNALLRAELEERYTALKV